MPQGYLRASRLKADAQADGIIGLLGQGAWRRSSRCGPAGSCVEVADLPAGSKALRDGKLGQASPQLVFSAEEWDAFISGVKAGEFE